MTQDAAPAVLLERAPGIARLTLNRPEALNAINNAMRADLARCLAEAAADPGVNVIVILGAGERAFCVGADLKEFAAGASRPDVAFEAHWPRAFETVRQPIVAAIHGHCLGGGLELALACDIRIAAADARFALPEVTHGVIPGAGGTQRLARAIGQAGALHLILTGRRFGADEALRLGLVAETVPSGRLAARAEELAQQLAALPAAALRNAKEAVKRGADMPLQDGLRLEYELSKQLRGSRERTQAGRAFEAKRSPDPG